MQRTFFYGLHAFFMVYTVAALWWLLSGDNSGWLARNQCGPWAPALVLEYKLANFAIMVSYFLLPVFLTLARLRDPLILSDQWIGVFTVYFIYACGFAHGVEGLGAFYRPNYVLFTHVNTVTAVISVVTVLAFPIRVRLRSNEAE